MGVWFYVLAFGALAWVGFRWHRMHSGVGWVCGALAVLFVGQTVVGTFATHMGQIGMDAVWNAGHAAVTAVSSKH